MAVRLAAAVLQLMPEYAASIRSEIAKRIGPETARITDEAKQALRRDTSAVLGPRMANTWRGKVYPSAIPTKTLKPAGLVYSSAPRIAAAFDPPATIRAKNATWLAIPTENVPRRGKKRMSPREVDGRYNQELDLVPSRRPGVMLLVMRGVANAKTGAFRKATAKRIQSGRGIASFVMFILVRQVRLKTRLNWKSVMATYERQFATRITSAAYSGLQAAQ